MSLILFRKSRAIFLNSCCGDVLYPRSAELFSMNIHIWHEVVQGSTHDATAGASPGASRESSHGCTFFWAKTFLIG